MVYSQLKIKYQGVSYTLELQGEAVYEEYGEGFSIDATNPIFKVNGEEKTKEELKELFDTNTDEIVDALYERAFDLPPFMERKVH